MIYDMVKMMAVPNKDKNLAGKVKWKKSICVRQ